MWYTPSMAIQDDLVDAKQAVLHAQRVRQAHRRRTSKGAPQREDDIRLALERLKEAMRPLRSYIGRLPFSIQGTEPQEAASVREASQAIQKERRKLWKMQKR